MSVQIDALQLYFGEDYIVNDYIRIHQPTVGEIMRMGEGAYFNLIYSLIAIPSDLKAQLDMMGINWEEIEDFELFCMIATALPIEQTRLLFGDIDFREFEIVPLEEQRGCYLRHKKLGFNLDEVAYMLIVQYLCELHKIKQKKEVAGNEVTRRILLEEARAKMRKRATQKKQESQLMPLISTMVNMPGFKYTTKQLKDVGVYEFMDSVARIQVIQSSLALIQGCYSGNVDMKKLNKKELNFMRDLSHG